VDTGIPYMIIDEEILKMIGQGILIVIGLTFMPGILSLFNFKKNKTKTKFWFFHPTYIVIALGILRVLKLYDRYRF